MKIRETIEALLKENAELRQGALAHGLTLGVGFVGRDAGRAALKRLDDLDVRIAEYLAEALRPQPYENRDRLYDLLHEAAGYLTDKPELYARISDALDCRANL